METQATKPSGPAIDQYLGVWAIAPNHMPGTLPSPIAGVNARDIVSEVNGFTFSESNPMPRIGNIAIIELRGPMSKYGSFFSSAGSTVMARKKIAVAKADPTIEGAMLLNESPGGAMAGNLDLANDIANFGKPVGAFIEDLGASANYQIASQADFISTTKTSLVGSIGTFSAVYDYSEYLGNLGIKAIVIKAGDLKGMGVVGTEITEEHQAELQRIVNGANEHFLESVASGRNMSIAEVRGLADGAIHFGEEAKSLGLVDHIESFEKALSRLQNSISPSGETVMSEQKTDALAPQAATLPELKACCPNAGADFYMEQLEAGSTKADAQQAFILKMQADMNQAQQEALKAKADAEVATAKAQHAQMKKEGNEPVEGSNDLENDFDTSVVAEFEAIIAQNVANGMDRITAVSQADLDNPGMRLAYLEHKQVVDRSAGLPGRN